MIPIASYAQVARICSLCDAAIPDDLDAAMQAMGGDLEAEALLGVAYASRQCEELLAGGAPGIHFYALNRAPGTRAVLSALRASRPWERLREQGRSGESMMPAAADGTFEWKGYNLAYSDFGSGDRALVLMHGLLMNRHMFDRHGARDRLARATA